MTTANFGSLLRMLCLSVALFSVGVNAAPILMNADAADVSIPNASSAVFAGPTDSLIFTNMGVNGGHQQSVSFRGEDESVFVGHYSKGPWSKDQFLRAWQDMIGNNGGSGVVPGTVPIPQPLTRLPEPSTLALLGLGMLALGALRHRRSKR